MELLITGSLMAVCAVGATLGNGPIRALLRRIDPPTPGGPAQPSLLGVAKELPGGRWIGILERLATYICLVTGFPAGIAMILAVKGLGRYPELRTGENPRVGELFIIGTFASLLWAVAWAGLALGGQYVSALIAQG